jgi:membrane protease YdiL (CAAX protease family)
MDKPRETPTVSLYLLLTLIFCSVPYALIGYTKQVSGGNGGYVVALMWGPAAAALVTIWWRKLDWASLGFSWRHTPSAWLGYLLPILYAAIAYGIVWIAGLGGFAQPEAVQALATRLGWTFTDPATFVPAYVVFVGLTGIVSATARGLGEEIGWRGFLTPHLHARFGYTGGTLITGVIWTLWHVPLILFANYNNGAPSVFALTCFFVMVMNLSFIMTWLRLRSGSVWPCAILHGSHNLFIQQIFTPLTSPRGDVTAYAIDEFGFMIPAVTFVVALVFWLYRDRAIAAERARSHGTSRRNV